MIEEQYVSFETAKLLKGKGFPQYPCICNTIYKPKGEFSINAKSFWNPFAASLLGREYFMAPTQQMAMRWLREVHHIHVCPEYKAFFQERPKKIYHHWCSKIFGIDRYFKRGINDVDVLDSDYFFFSINAQAYHDSYEEACEECIKFALENLVTD